MLDDDRLAELFGRAAEAFEVPASGPAEILALAERPARGGTEGTGAEDGGAEEAAEVDGTPDELGRRRRLVAVARRHRVLSVAACVVVALVAAGTIGALVRAPSGPTVTSGLRAPLRGVPAPAGGAPLSTTTVPGLGHAPLGANVGAPAKGATGSASSGTGTALPAQPNAPSLPQGAVGQSTKIEETGTLGLTVGRGAVGRTITRLSALATLYGGFVANSQSQSGSGSPYGNVTLQVPVDNFAAALKQAERLGKVSDLSTKATDVTGQYVDLQARIGALEASRQQYLTILSKATSIGDVLSVQEQIDGIQAQIEQLQGQLQVLTGETSYSTLNVAVNERTPPPRAGPLPESGLVRAWHDSVGGFVDGVEGVVRVAGPFLFALLCLALVAVGGRVLWRRYQRHRL